MNTHQILAAIRSHSPTPEVKAAITFLLRQADAEKPAGTYDVAGRWHPAMSEGFDLLGLRAPSRAYPHSLLDGARTAKHCAHLHNADASEVRRLARRLRAAGDDVAALRKCLPPEDAAGLGEN